MHVHTYAHTYTCMSIFLSCHLSILVTHALGILRSPRAPAIRGSIPTCVPRSPPWREQKDRADTRPRLFCSNGGRCWWALAPPQVLVPSLYPCCSLHLHALRAGTANRNPSWRPLRASVCLSCLTLGTAKPLVFLSC